MEVNRICSGVVTDQQSACKEFYTQLFGFQVVYEKRGRLHLRSRDGVNELRFMPPGQLSQPKILRPAYEGRGCWLHLEVDDADRWYQKVVDHSVPIELALREEPWGERHFIIRDPAGMAIDVAAESDESVSSFLP